MRSQLLWDMSDMAKAPRQVARTREDMENTIWELHTELPRECKQGSLVLLVQSAKGLNKLPRYLSGILRTLNGERCETRIPPKY